MGARESDEATLTSGAKILIRFQPRNYDSIPHSAQGDQLSLYRVTFVGEIRERRSFSFPDPALTSVQRGRFGRNLAV